MFVSKQTEILQTNWNNESWCLKAAYYISIQLSRPSQAAVCRPPLTFERLERWLQITTAIEHKKTLELSTHKLTRLLMLPAQSLTVGCLAGSRTLNRTVFRVTMEGAKHFSRMALKKESNNWTIRISCHAAFFGWRIFYSKASEQNCFCFVRWLGQTMFNSMEDICAFEWNSFGMQQLVTTSWDLRELRLLPLTAV